MKIFILIFLSTTLFIITACAEGTTEFEQSVIERVESEPDTAYEYFMEKIEGGATVEEQAVYLYGMGIAHEKQGNKIEAINDYLGAEALGYEPATVKLKKLID